MKNAIAISFDVEQIAAALEDAGFEAFERNVADIAQYVKNGGESVENFDAAFRTLIVEAATDLKIGRAGSSRARFDRRIE